MNKEMKIMYLFRAMPGSGKSTLINKYELQSNTLSFDTFRELFSGQSIGQGGKVEIDQKYNDFIMSFFKEALKKRMQERSVIIIDNLNSKASDLNGYNELAVRNGYKVKVVNFPLEDLEFYLERNKQRSERKSLPEKSIQRIYKTFKEFNVKECKPELISVDDFISEISTPISNLCVDLNGYNKVHHIGDILGSGLPLVDAMEDYNDDDFYIFVGNYFDLGNTPEKVVDILKEIYNKDNVVFLRGNYDNKLGFFINDLIVHDDLFNDITKGKIYKDKNFIKKFYYNLKDYYAYEFADKKVFVNNAGVSNLPQKPYLINASTFTEGSGSNVFDIGYNFDLNAPKGWTQVHGYRNFKGQRNDSVEVKSFSLATDVAVGGCLTDLVLDDTGFKRLEYKNDDFNMIVKNAYDKQFFQSFKDSQKIVLKDAIKSERKNSTILHHFDDFKTYTVGNSIVCISKEDSNTAFAIAREERMHNLYISTDNNKTLVVDSDFNLVKNIDIPNGILELTKKFNSIAHCSVENGSFVILDFYNKDKNKNKLKKSLYEGFESKSNILFFKNEVALNGFLKSIKSGSNKRYSSDIVVEYSSGERKQFKIKKQNLRNKR